MLPLALDSIIAFVNGLCFWHWLASVYLGLIIFERFHTRAAGAHEYDTKDAICSIAIGAIGTVVQFTLALIIPLSIYTFVYQEWQLVTIDSTAIAIGAAFIVHDFAHYWVHRLGHRVGVFWSFHAVHHSSNAFNHTTALRLFPTDGRLKILAGLVAALCGVPPEIYLAAALLKSGYSMWTHASYIRGLAWMEWVFVTPRLHMVHHASQTEYLDRNYGQVLIIWDRIFGTFAGYEKEPISGLVHPVHDNNPFTAQLVGIRDLAAKIKLAPCWRQRFLCLSKPPEWTPR